jgi:Family of unknown function (DUF5681)
VPEFRFKKGTSGNLKGRPPKERALVTTKFGGQPGIGFGSRIKAIAIEEAYRLITVREGDRIEKVPVIQAILRKVAVNAANGNTRAQRIYLDLVIGAEADRSAAAAELLRAAVEGKEYWAGVFAEYDRRGIDRPDPVPHPDHVVIDYKKGEVQIKGPVMTEQKDARETAIFLQEAVYRSQIFRARELHNKPSKNLAYGRLGAGSGTSGTASAMASVRSSGSYATRLGSIMRARHRSIMSALTSCDRVEKESGCSSPRNAEASDKMLRVIHWLLSKK